MQSRINTFASISFYLIELSDAKENYFLLSSSFHQALNILNSDLVLQTLEHQTVALNHV